MFVIVSKESSRVLKSFLTREAAEQYLIAQKLSAGFKVRKQAK